jgi:hypothetical protein
MCGTVLETGQPQWLKAEIYKIESKLAEKYN